MNLGLNPLTPPRRQDATLRSVPAAVILSLSVLNVAVGKLISVTSIHLGVIDVRLNSPQRILYCVAKARRLTSRNGTLTGIA